MLEHILAEIAHLPTHNLVGKVLSVKGLLVECSGIEKILSVGARCQIEGIIPINGRLPKVIAEVIGFREDRALLMPYNSLEGIGLGAQVTFLGYESAIFPDDSWLGRVINPLGEPMDSGGILPMGKTPYKLRGEPPPAHTRQRVRGKIDLGVRAINTFLSCCRGQRMGIFAGSGVGKSILMSMLARYSQADVNVIGLVGERGREVQEFIEDDLGEEGLKRSVVVVATSSDSALMRRQASYFTLSVAEYFRDQGKNVLCIMDSVTRFAMAQREIGLSAGEPPTTKGYTPTVFSELPMILERAGPGAVGSGSITAMFSVLVDGDDHNEPIADAVRGILDGHIILDRSIAERGRFPAINILRSVSRTMPDCNTEEENKLVTAARQILSTYENMAEMIRLGAYRKGTDPEVDRAIQIYPAIDNFLRQRKDEPSDLERGYTELARILGMK
ncbi:MAG TPA: flagellar protein export ATPase FliI [Rickettsiales bacterium]|nr:flagellar protein export ATPase FliI [Rickettsiales bacterium]